MTTIFHIWPKFGSDNISVSAESNYMSTRSASKRKASKSIPDESEVHSKFKKCLANYKKYEHFGKIMAASVLPHAIQPIVIIFKKLQS